MGILFYSARVLRGIISQLVAFKYILLWFKYVGESW